jgi:hypothetical protein
MHEEILAAVIGRDEAEALGVVEPLYGTCTHVCVCFLIIVGKKGALRRSRPCGKSRENEQMRTVRTATA